MLAGFEQRPRRRGETHTAHVEIREPRTALVKDVIDPGKNALAGLRIALLDGSIDDVVRQPIAFDYDEAFRLCKRGECEDKKYSRNGATAQSDPHSLKPYVELCAVHLQG